MGGQTCRIKPLFSGENPGSCKIRGIGTGFISSILNTLFYTAVTDDKAFPGANELGAQEGILGGISTGAAITAILKKSGELPPGSRILNINYDTGEKYLPVKGLFRELAY